MMLLILVLKGFSTNFILPKEIYQTVEKNQLLIILPFLGDLFFETRTRIEFLKLKMI